MSTSLTLAYIHKQLVLLQMSCADAHMPLTGVLLHEDEVLLGFVNSVHSSVL